MPVLKNALRVLNTLLCVLLVLLLGANIYTIAARAFTHKPQPEINVHDLIVVREQEEYTIGDVITYENGDSVVTHRIVGRSGSCFITRGDNNNTNDLYPVAESAVVGKVVLSVPRAGLFVEYLRTPLGMCCMVFIGLLLIEIPYLLQKSKAKAKGNN